MFLLSTIHHHPKRQEQEQNANVTWIIPTANQTLQAGQDYFAKWSASSTPNSPSFQLCTDSGVAGNQNNTIDGNCGSPVVVPVQQDQGVYFVSLAMPNITSTDLFVMKMHDGTGLESESPRFFVTQTPSSVNGSANSTNGPDTASTASQANSSSPGISFQLHDPQGPDDHPLLIPKPDAPTVFKRDLTEFFPTHAPMYTALAIIPLLLVTAGLAISIFLWFRQRRNNQLKRLYLTDHPMVYPRRPQPKTLNSAEDLEFAVQTLSKERWRKPERDSFKRRGSRAVEKEEGHRRVDRDLVEPPFSSASPKVTSYEPESRSLTDSYFPPVPALGPTRSREGHSTLLGDSLVESPMEILAAPPPPSVTKLSERLHVRTRSDSNGGSNHFIHSTTESQGKLRGLGT